MTFDQALGKYAAHMRDNGVTGELPLINEKHSKTNTEGAWLLKDIDGDNIAYVDKHGVERLQK